MRKLRIALAGSLVFFGTATATLAQDAQTKVAKFAYSGTIFEVRLSLDEGEEVTDVRVSCATCKGELLLMIRENGVGITPAGEPTIGFAHFKNPDRWIGVQAGRSLKPAEVRRWLPTIKKLQDIRKGLHPVYTFTNEDEDAFLRYLLLHESNALVDVTMKLVQ